MIGRLLIGIGIAMMASQAVADRPWQALFAFGLLLVIAGGLTLVGECDELALRGLSEQEPDSESETCSASRDSLPVA